MVDPLPSLESLRVFEAAARHLSFTRAGEELHVTHGAVSQRIKGLEDHLGISLFRRSGRAMVLTAAGRGLAVRVATGMAEIRQGIRELPNRGDQDTITISVLPAFATRWLIPRLPSFTKLHPVVNVITRATSSLADFESEDVDLAVRFGEGDWPGLESEKLFDEYLFPVCSPTFNDGRIPDSTASLPQHTLLHDERQPWSLFFDPLGIPFPLAIHGSSYNDTNLLLEAAASGHGVALARAALVERDVESGRLRRLCGRQVRTRKSYYLVYKKDALSVPSLAAFRHWLAEASGEMKVPVASCDQERDEPPGLAA